jgi:excinuclease ABC subunit A
MCPTSGISYDDPDPHHFSFNSPHGACPTCKGLGFVNQVDMDKIIPDKTISIYNGGIAPLGKYRNTVIFWQVEAILEKYGCQLKIIP